MDGLDLNKLTWSGWPRERAILAETYSDVEDDKQMKPTVQQSSQMERGQRRLKETGEDPYTLMDQEDNRDSKPRRLEGTPPKAFDGDRSNTVVTS